MKNREFLGNAFLIEPHPPSGQQHFYHMRKYLRATVGYGMLMKDRYILLFFTDIQLWKKKHKSSRPSRTFKAQVTLTTIQTQLSSPSRQSITSQGSQFHHWITFRNVFLELKWNILTGSFYFLALVLRPLKRSFLGFSYLWQSRAIWGYWSFVYQSFYSTDESTVVPFNYPSGDNIDSNQLLMEAHCAQRSLHVRCSKCSMTCKTLSSWRR